MNKQEFLDALKRKLCGLPQKEIEGCLNFYSEIIDDKTDSALTEEEAVSEFPDIDELASQIVADIPLTKLAKEKIRPKRKLKAWERVLLWVGSPIWLSLAVAAFAVIIALYAAFWSVVVSFWAVFFSVFCVSLAALAFGIGAAIFGNPALSLALIGTGIACIGLSILLIFMCRAATKGALRLAKAITLGAKKCFLTKEAQR